MFIENKNNKNQNKNIGKIVIVAEYSGKSSNIAYKIHCYYLQIISCNCNLTTNIHIILIKYQKCYT